MIPSPYAPVEQTAKMKRTSWEIGRTLFKRERKRATSGCYNECAWGVMTSNFKSEKLITRRKTVSEKDGFNTVVGRWVRVCDAEVHKPLH